MEIALAAGTLRVAYQLLITGIQVEQVPNAVRRCIELVRTCHGDLEDLIKLRNESLPMLETKPAILQRINTIIENAHKGLLEVARLVEKLRPEAHDGSSPIMGRLEWIFIDSREFSSQEPLISRQHSSVIAELNFLRQLILLTPLLDGAGPSGRGTGSGGGNNTGQRSPLVAWENVGLLDEMLGGRRQTIPQQRSSTPMSGPGNPPTASQITPVHRLSSPTPNLADPPPPYSSPKPDLGSPTFQIPPDPGTAVTNPLVYNAAVTTSSTVPTVGRVESAYRNEIKSKTTTFDTDGMAFLFGDLKIDPKPKVDPGQAQPEQPLHPQPQQSHQLPHQVQPQRSQTPVPPPVPPQEPLPNPKPLSTIPQELIHRHDGVDSSPPQPLFSPVTTSSSLGRPQSLQSVASVAGYSMQSLNQPWQQQQQSGTEPKIPPIHGQQDCCTSCGSSIRDSLQASKPLPPPPPREPHTSQHQHQHHPDQQFWPQPLALRQSWTAPPAARPTSQGSIPGYGFEPTQGNGALHHHQNQDQSQGHLHPAPSLDQMYRHPSPSPSVQPPHPQHIQPGQPPPTLSGLGGGFQNNIQTFATVREHWKPETLAGVGPSQLQLHQQQPPPPDPIQHPQHPPPPGPMAYGLMTQGMNIDIGSNNPTATSWGQPPQQAAAHYSGGAPVPDPYGYGNASAAYQAHAQQYQQSLQQQAYQLGYTYHQLQPGYQQPSQQGSTYYGQGLGPGPGHVASQNWWDGKPVQGNRTIQSEVYELPAVKFAPDPVELE